MLVAFEGDGDAAAEAARGAAMQVSAMRAQYVSRDAVPADLVENERSIAEAIAKNEGKPEQALPKIIDGRVNGFFKEVVLLEQSSVREPKRTVKALLDEAGRDGHRLRPLRGRRLAVPARVSSSTFRRRGGESIMIRRPAVRVLGQTGEGLMSERPEGRPPRQEPPRDPARNVCRTSILRRAPLVAGAAEAVR